MAGSKTLFLQNAVLNGVLGGTTYNKQTTVYIALSTAVFTASATGSNMSEVPIGTGNYQRVAVTNDSSSWTTATNGSKSNNAVFTFNAATANWGNVVSFYILDGSGTTANTLYGADLTTARTINNGDTASFAVGAITLTET